MPFDHLKAKLKDKLLTPILDPAYSPEYTARGVAIGLLVALTPTVGMQIPILMVIWPLVKTCIPRWSFNIVAAIAWTFITNIFTLPLFYYLFIVTGRLMLGRWERVNTYEVFEERLPAYTEESAHWFYSLIDNMTQTLQEFGLPLLLGSLPWAIGGAYLGYRWTLRLIEKRRSNN